VKGRMTGSEHPVWLLRVEPSLSPPLTSRLLAVWNGMVTCPFAGPTRSPPAGQERPVQAARRARESNNRMVPSVNFDHRDKATADRPLQTFTPYS